MICRVCQTLIVYLTLGTLPLQAQQLDINALTFYTEIYPPFSFQKDGYATGISSDVLIEILERLEAQKRRSDIIILPWKRAYATTLIQKNTVLFPMVRATAREKLFKWVGPIGISPLSVISRKDQDIQISSLADFRKYVVGVIDQDMAHIALINTGAKPKHTYAISSPASAIRMLERGRIQLWASSSTVSQWLITQQGYSLDTYQIVYDLGTFEYYFALNVETDDLYVSLLQETLEAIREDGTLRKIKSNYLPENPISSLNGAQK